MIITLGNEVTKLITDIKNAQIELTINSGWGTTSLRRYKNQIMLKLFNYYISI